MAIYCVTYDVGEAGTQELEALAQKVKRFPNHCQALESTWLISTHWNSEQVTAYLKSALDACQRLVVVPVRGWSVGQSPAVPGPVSAWLQKHCPPPNESVSTAPE